MTSPHPKPNRVGDEADDNTIQNALLGNPIKGFMIHARLIDDQTGHLVVRKPGFKIP